MKRFVEKPDLDTAKGFLQAGTFLWNSGMFCFTASTLVDELAQHAPALLEQAMACQMASQPADFGSLASSRSWPAEPSPRCRTSPSTMR